MRIQNSLRNMITAVMQIVVTIILRFIAQSYFIHILGLKYQGLNGLFSSIIGMLGIAELGLGTAILFNMYEYIAKRDIETIKSLLKFYQRCYQAIAGFVIFFGLALMPFLHVFVNMSSINENVYVIYLLFLADSAFSYLLIYKQSILIAHQKKHLINLADLAYTIIYNLGQIALLILTHNYILILLLVLFLRLAENIMISRVADRRYPYIKDKNVQLLDKKIARRLIKQMKGQAFHVIGGFVVFGTDNMIISSFLGLTVMGLYSNYLLITNTLNSFLLQVVGSVTPSVGDLLTEKNSKENFKVHQHLTFICFWLYSFSAIGIYIVTQPFIELWLGKNYLLSGGVLLVVALNFYVQGMRSPMTVFQQAAGIFYENRFVPVAEAITNLIASIVLIKYLGLAGVLLGTIICTMILYGYSFPKYTFVPIFKKKVSVYVIEQLSYLFIFALLFISTVVVSHFLDVINVWGNFILKIVICLIIPNALLILLFRKSREFRYFRSLVNGLFSKNNS